MGKDHSSFNAKRKNSRSRNLKKIILYVEALLSKEITP